MQKETTLMNENYTPDVLDGGFEQMTLHLEDDYEGKVVATLVRKESKSPSERAVLYVHGFNDYFFQTELAERFVDEGFHFYALDIRKYGRSFLNHQKLNNVRSLLEYDEEITKALKMIQSEGRSEVTLVGHSTGGLIVTSFAGRHLNSDLFHGVICNSPFYEFNINPILRNIGIPLVSALGKSFPNTLISINMPAVYGHSLHKEKYGEWNYSLAWKPHDIPKVNLGFVNAIRNGHKHIQNNLVIDVPMLVMYSSKSVYEKKWSEKLMEGDAVLNVKHIQHFARKIKGDVSTYEAENGMHDLVLSKKPVREKVYEKMFEWIKMKR